MTPNLYSNTTPVNESDSRWMIGDTSKTEAAGGSALVFAATLNLSLKAYFIPVCAALAVLSNACVVLVLRRRRLVKVCCDQLITDHVLNRGGNRAGPNAGRAGLGPNNILIR